MKMSTEMQEDTYGTDEYLRFRSHSAEEGDLEARALIAWINSDSDYLTDHLRYGPDPDRNGMPPATSVERVVKLIDTINAAGAALVAAAKSWPKRDLYNDSPSELATAYRLVNRMLHAYRGEYGIDTHPNLPQPGHSKFRVPKKYLLGEMRDWKMLDDNPTAGLAIEFGIASRFPIGEQHAVADLIRLLQDQRFHLLRRCTAPIPSRRGDREIKQIPSCNKWFLATRIDHEYCSKGCNRRMRENTPAFREARKIWAKNEYESAKNRSV